MAAHQVPRPWDSPGKNTGVGCHFESEVAQSCPTLSDPMDYSLPGSSIHGIFQIRILVAQMVKHPPAMRETRVQSLSWEDPLEEEMATHSSILAWEIPWMEEPGRLQFMGSQSVRHD